MIKIEKGQHNLIFYEIYYNENDVKCTECKKKPFVVQRKYTYLMIFLYQT